MPIFVTAAGDASREVCEGGVKRREAFVKKYNLTYDSPINLLDVLKEYGANDTLFLLGVAMHPGKQQAETALREYAAFLLTQVLDRIRLPKAQWPYLTKAVGAAIKVGLGKSHEPAIAAAHEAMKVLAKVSYTPAMQSLVNVVVSLTLPNRPLHDVVNKADACFQEYAVFVGQPEQIAKLRAETLGKLIE